MASVLSESPNPDSLSANTRSIKNKKKAIKNIIGRTMSRRKVK